MQGITWASIALPILQIKKLRFREVDPRPGIALQSHREMKQVHMQVRMTTEPMPIASDPDEKRVVLFDSSRCCDSLDLGISGSSHRFQVLPFQFGFRR